MLKSFQSEARAKLVSVKASNRKKPSCACYRSCIVALSQLEPPPLSLPRYFTKQVEVKETYHPIAVIPC